MTPSLPRRSDTVQPLPSPSSTLQRQHLDRPQPHHTQVSPSSHADGSCYTELYPGPQSYVERLQAEEGSAGVDPLRAEDGNVYFSPVVETVSCFKPSRYQSPLMGKENKPLEVGVLRRVKELLVEVDPRTMAKHITKADCMVLFIAALINICKVIGTFLRMDCSSAERFRDFFILVWTQWQLCWRKSRASYALVITGKLWGICLNANSKPFLNQSVTDVWKHADVSGDFKVYFPAHPVSANWNLMQFLHLCVFLGGQNSGGHARGAKNDGRYLRDGAAHAATWTTVKTRPAGEVNTVQPVQLFISVIERCISDMSLIRLLSTKLVFSYLQIYLLSNVFTNWNHKL